MALANMDTELTTTAVITANNEIVIFFLAKHRCATHIRRMMKSHILFADHKNIIISQSESRIAGLYFLTERQ
ncbi:hypothetical protein B5F44_13790 [Gordonibacter urolithinfaciens]|nr:hypothetical protein B5F44_13790 [Gordonibacter urolithinfaciens]